MTWQSNVKIMNSRFALRDNGIFCGTKIGKFDVNQELNHILFCAKEEVKRKPSVKYLQNCANNRKNSSPYENNWT